MRRHRSPLALPVAAVAAILLLAGCNLVPYDEASLRGALFARDLDLLTEIGPFRFDGGDQERPERRAFHPSLPVGRTGYLITERDSRIEMHWVNGSSLGFIDELSVSGEQLTASYVARSTIGPVPTPGETRPLLVAAYNGTDLGRFDIYNPTGTTGSWSIADALAPDFSDTPIVVGVYFRALDDATDEITVLARERNSSTFREARFTVNASLLFTGPTYPAAGTFSLPALTDDVIIYNGALVHEPISGRSFLTVQDDRSLLTFGWTSSNPVASQQQITSMRGIVDHATRSGTVISRAGGDLFEYNPDGSLVNEYAAGSATPLGQYWIGTGPTALYSAVAEAHGLPDRTLTIAVYRR